MNNHHYTEMVSIFQHLTSNACIYHRELQFIIINYILFPTQTVTMVSIISTTHIKLKEPFWLQRRSHCSVINLAHVREPFVVPPSETELYDCTHTSTHTNLRELLREPRESCVWMAPLAPSKAPVVLCVKYWKCLCHPYTYDSGHAQRVLMYWGKWRK